MNWKVDSYDWELLSQALAYMSVIYGLLIILSLAAIWELVKEIRRGVERQNRRTETEGRVNRQRL